jgi:hypothetical protein
MNIRFLSPLLLAASLCGVGLLLPAAPALAAQHAAQVPDPARQIEQWAGLFRAGDVARLAEAMLPPSKWEEVQLAYELQQLEPLSEQERAEFAEKLERFTAPDAVDRLMAEIEPKLEEARPQAPGALMMAIGGMQLAIASPENKFTEEQRKVLQEALPGVQQWASSTDFLSSDTMREALTLLTDALRRTGVDNLEELKAMPLATVLDRAGDVLEAGKQAVRLYGLDLDRIADSLQVEVLEIDGERARVRTTITLFDAPVWGEHELVLHEGRWYPKGTVEHVHIAHADDVEAES